MIHGRKSQGGVVYEETTDQYLYLEEIEGEKAFGFAMNESEIFTSRFNGSPQYQKRFEDAFKISSDSAKPPEGLTNEGYYYTFLRTQEDPRGLWKRCPLYDFGNWEVVFRCSELPEPWTYQRASFSLFDENAVMLFLSEGGKDAVWGREFNLRTKKFVEGGIELPLGRQSGTWYSKDEFIFDTGPLTESGYPTQLAKIRRGQEIKDAEIVMKMDTQMCLMWSQTLEDESTKDKLTVFCQMKDFYRRFYFTYENNQIVSHQLPEKSYILGLDQGILYLYTDGDDPDFPMQSLYSYDLKQRGSLKRLWTAGKELNLESMSIFEGKFYLTLIQDCRSQIQIMDKNFQIQNLEIDQTASLELYGFDKKTKSVLVAQASFTKPKQVFVVNTNDDSKQLLWQGPIYWDNSNVCVKQFFCKSDDGTRIPYFWIGPKNFTNKLKTIVYGYGGFQQSCTPYYLQSIGKIWLEQGNAYVVANIRGGMEYGPKWHESVIQLNRKKCYQDFKSVIMDLYQKGMCDKNSTAMMGGSNGGLLVGATMCLYPDLVKAIDCSVPLLDMERYHLLLVGKSWSSEYGTVDDSEEMKKYILSYSPYQNVRAGTLYPEVLFTTSTYDDRVHPGHARKMYAKMKDQGHKVHYYEEKLGGHAGHAMPELTAKNLALRFSWLEQVLGGATATP